ncbi:MAG: DUF502 domain-containing protein [Desulfomonilaceae bacterium]
MIAVLRTLIRLFLTGAATLLPFVITLYIVSWGVMLADAHIGPSSNFGVFIVKLVGPDYKYLGYLVGYFVAIGLLILLGFLVTRATVARIQRAIDSTVAKIPLVGKIYMGVGQIVDLFGRKDQSGSERFGVVGQIRVGNVKILGFLTSGDTYIMSDGREHLLVYIPNSPIPFTGFNMLVPSEDFQRLEIPVEDAMKLLMSFGLLGRDVLKPAASGNKDHDVTQ